MPDDSSTGSTKPQTRSHTRYSLASVGKALGMNKDSSKDASPDKSAKRSKDTAARRSSVTAPTSSSRGRASVGEKPAATNPPPATAPTSRGTRRQSTLPAPTLDTPSEDSATPSAKDAPTPPMTRAASLRPRKAGNTSALPKYRPRSVHLEQALKKPPAPSPEKSSRRKLSSSDESWEELEEEKKEKNVSKLDDSSSETVPDKAARSISPPSGRAPKTSVNISVSPSPSVNKVQIPRRDSPNGPPAKATKKPSTPTPQSPTPAPARPPSSSSSSSSARSPRSPHTPTATRASKSKAVPIDTSVGKGSPLRHVVKGSREPPPTGNRQKAGSATPTSIKSIFNEGNSLESIDAADVEYMLGTGASPTAPTPAVPRIRKGRTPDEFPQTPSRHGSTLPSRQNMSYLSPMPPSRDESPSKRSLRPPGNDRGSLLSWDQLVAVGDMTLGEGEATSMIADMAAPFSGPSSPALSTISLPENDSPSLSTMPSPAGYGSISQILLPEVTPSPAKHAFGAPGRMGGSEGGLATMLKLQLASMEQIAKERLGQIQALEQQLQSAKQARMHETSELSRQMTLLEEQTRHALEARDRASEDQAGNIIALEEQLDVAISVREQAVKNAAKKATEIATKERDKAARVEVMQKDLFCAVKGAEMGWESVKDVASGEVEFVKASREMLGVLLAGLEVSRMQIIASATTASSK